jgi:RNA recognition motif-containing protein
MEILQIFVFIASIIYMKRKLTEYRIKNDEILCQIQDFSIMVRNLPLDCTEEKIINHFSNLYSLTEIDWVKRPKLRGAKPVKKSIRQSDKRLFKGKWVADCFIYTKIGAYIDAFKNKQHLILKLERLTMQQSMYSKNTCHSGGYDPIRLKQVKKEKLKVEKVIDKLTQRMVKAKNLKFEDKELEEVKQKHNKKNEVIEEKKEEDKEIKISADPVAAFITFQYSESMARCLEDYEKYDSFPYNLVYPDKLLFEGKRLRIEKSPEPDEILWENLEVSDGERFVLQTRTNIATIILIMVCFALIVQAKIYKDVFRDSLPNLSYCDKIIPQDYLPTFTDTELNELRLIRPIDQSLRLDLDSQCNNILDTSFYAYYVQSTNESFPLLNYNISSCLNNTQQDLKSFCPDPFRSTFCPCLVVEVDGVNQNCGTACSADVNEINNDANCGVYPLETLGSCACYDFLSDIISTQGISGVFSIISSLSSTDGCYSFMTSYSSSTFLSYFAIFITVFINVVLQVSLKILTKLERHASRDSMESSLMFRVFIATYLVLAIVSLVVFGKVQSISNVGIFQSFQIFQGPYNDFNSEWYGDVGSFLLTTFIIKAIQFPLIKLLKFYVLSPLKRFINYSNVRNKSGHNIITQLECNKLAVGSEFDLNKSSSTIMTLLFMAMTYGAGIPMFMPLLCAIFGFTYYVDKLLMCRYYQKPPLISAIMMTKIVTLLPFAAVIRMSFAIWMFGNPDVLQSAHNTYADIFLQQTSSIGIGEGPQFIMARILRPNSLPLFCLLCLLLFITVSYTLNLHEKLPIFWAMRKIWDVISKSKNSKVGLDVVSQYAGFISPYKLLMLNDPNRKYL